LEGLAARLLAAGARNVVLKLGARGVFLAGRDVSPVLVPAFPAAAVDTTAAGDVFNGGFACGLVRGMAPAEAARFGCAAAAISVTRRGAQPSMPALAEVEELLRQAGGGGR
jgi:ribokinase